MTSGVAQQEQSGGGRSYGDDDRTQARLSGVREIGESQERDEHRVHGHSRRIPKSEEPQDIRREDRADAVADTPALKCLRWTYALRRSFLFSKRVAEPSKSNITECGSGIASPLIHSPPAARFVFSSCGHAAVE